MNKEKSINFRIDAQLHNVICQFAKEKGYKNISELLREIVIMHFMGLMLGYFQNKDLDTIMSDFIVKYKDLVDSETKKKDIA